MTHTSSSFSPILRVTVLSEWGPFLKQGILHRNSRSKKVVKQMRIRPPDGQAAIGIDLGTSSSLVAVWTSSPEPRSRNVDHDFFLFFSFHKYEQWTMILSIWVCYRVIVIVVSKCMLCRCSLGVIRIFHVYCDIIFIQWLWWYGFSISQSLTLRHFHKKNDEQGFWVFECKYRVIVVVVVKCMLCRCSLGVKCSF